MKKQVKDEGKGGERTRKFQAKLATTRGDDFVDPTGTHISAWKACCIMSVWQVVRAASWNPFYFNLNRWSSPGTVLQKEWLQVTSAEFINSPWDLAKTKGDREVWSARAPPAVLFHGNHPPSTVYRGIRHLSNERSRDHSDGLWGTASFFEGLPADSQTATPKANAAIREGASTPSSASPAPKKPPRKQFFTPVAIYTSDASWTASPRWWPPPPGQCCAGGKSGSVERIYDDSRGVQCGCRWEVHRLRHHYSAARATPCSSGGPGNTLDVRLAIWAEMWRADLSIDKAPDGWFGGTEPCDVKLFIWFLVGLNAKSFDWPLNRFK